MSSKKKSKKKNLEIPEDYDIYESVDELHAVPSKDMFEHDLDFYSCPCGCYLVNKTGMMDGGSERAIYFHRPFPFAMREA